MAKVAIVPEAALAVIGGKWKVLILWALRSEARRFGELRRSVQGISEKMLIQHLKEMEADGVVKRREYKRPPPLKISTKTGRARARARDYRKRARASPRDQGILEILERSRL